MKRLVGTSSYPSQHLDILAKEGIAGPRERSKRYLVALYGLPIEKSEMTVEYPPTALPELLIFAH